MEDVEDRHMNKKYKNVSEMVNDLADKEFKQEYKNHSDRTALSSFLFKLRAKHDITQKEMAKRLDCTQGKISKIENSYDEDLQLKDLIGYAKALNLQLSLGFLKQNRTSADSIKYHALKIKEHLDRLAELPDGDEQLFKGVSGFFGEYFFNMLNMFQKSVEKLNIKNPHMKETIHITNTIDVHEKPLAEVI